MSILKVKIPSWSKYNPRNDRKNYSWFRFENGFFHNQKIYGLTDSEIIVFQFLLCEASKKSSDEVIVNLDYIAAFRRTTVEKISEEIQTLESRGVVVTSKCRQKDVKTTAKRQPTYVTNVTNETVVSAVVKNTTTPTSPTDLINSLGKEIGDQLRILYPAEYVEREAIKAMNWVRVNPRRSPKSVSGFKKFFLSWLERGWERERKNQPSGSGQESGFAVV